MRNYEEGAGFAGSQVDSNPTTTINTVAKEDVKVGSFVELTADGVQPLSGAGKVTGLVTKSDATRGDVLTAGSNVTLATVGNFYTTTTTATTANTAVKVVNTGVNVGLVNADGTDAEVISATFQETSIAGLVAVKINL